MATASEEKRQALRTNEERYKKKNTKRYPAFVFNTVLDSDIIELLDTIENRQGLIKAALRYYAEICGDNLVAEPQRRLNEKVETKSYPGLSLNLGTDADLIEMLDVADNRQGLVKAALRSYVKENKVKLSTKTRKTFFRPSGSKR